MIRISLNQDFSELECHIFASQFLVDWSKCFDLREHKQNELEIK